MASLFCEDRRGLYSFFAINIVVCIVSKNNFEMVLSKRILYHFLLTYIHEDKKVEVNISCVNC